MLQSLKLELQEARGKIVEAHAKGHMGLREASFIKAVGVIEGLDLALNLVENALKSEQNILFGRDEK